MTERGEVQREIVDTRVKRESEFPEDPEKRFEAIFSAIGNSEAKCLTLLCLSRSPITNGDLHRRFLTNSAYAWKTDQRLQSAYCSSTLIPIGIVASADVIHQGSDEYVTGYKVTISGEKYGQPIAAYLLEQSSKVPYSLIDIFGPTSASGGNTRPVSNRARILELLSENNTGLREVDLSQHLTLGASPLGSHLRHLSKLGLVKYSAVDLDNKAQVTYSLNENVNIRAVKPVYRQVTLTNEVAHLLFELKTVDAAALAEKLIIKHPKIDPKVLHAAVSSTLSGLSRQGVCSRKFFDQQTRSYAMITGEGQNLVTNLIKPIREALADEIDVLTSFKSIPWQNYAPNAILKYKEASAFANSQPTEEGVLQTLGLIQANPGIRQKEIRTRLGKIPTHFLKNLVDSKRVRKVKEGLAVHYYPNKQN